jgi:hypothetical protein
LKSPTAPKSGPPPLPVVNGEPLSAANPLPARSRTDMLLLVPLMTATSGRPLASKSALTTPKEATPPSAYGEPASGVNEACAGAAARSAASATRTGHRALGRLRACIRIRQASTAESRSANARPIRPDGMREYRGRSQSDDQAAFCRDLQLFLDYSSGREEGPVCYSSVNQLLEPRPGGD